jgi:ketosteroid isomerase-like protein
VADSLLAADRAYAAAARQQTPRDAIMGLLAATALVPVPPGTFARGREAVRDALDANPDNASGHLEWWPIRAGVSADGQHGFTVGYMTLQRVDGSRTPLKYLAYWIRERGNWRAAVYRRGRSAEGAVPRDLMPPALPLALIAPVSDEAVITGHRRSLAAAEQAFSDEAQRIGIGPAFTKYGSADAVNMGGPNAPTFVVGADAIGRHVGAGGPVAESPVTWAADYDVLVASSGDLGASLGFIKPKTPPTAGQPTATPFVTIWRRASPSEPWRYVAE